MSIAILSLLLRRKLRPSRSSLVEAILRDQRHGGAISARAECPDGPVASWRAQECAAAIIGERIEADLAEIERLLTDEFRLEDPSISLRILRLQDASSTSSPHAHRVDRE